MAKVARSREPPQPYFTANAAECIAGSTPAVKRFCSVAGAIRILGGNSQNCRRAETLHGWGRPGDALCGVRREIGLRRLSTSCDFRHASWRKLVPSRLIFECSGFSPTFQASRFWADHGLTGSYSESECSLRHSGLLSPGLSGYRTNAEWETPCGVRELAPAFSSVLSSPRKACLAQPA